LYIFNCAVCNKSFSSTQPHAKYCSYVCKRVGKGKVPLENVHICLYCGCKFISSDKNKKFCNNKCKGSYYKPFEVYTYICKNCNVEYKTNIRKDKYFCSDNCRFDYYSFKLICKHCGKYFQSLNKESFCSYKCRKEHKKQLSLKYNEKYTKKTQSQYYIKNNKIIPTYSRGERKLYDLITYTFYDCEILYRKRYEWLTNPETGYPLELDIFIPALNLAFEYDGVQHYVFNKFIHKNEKEFIKSKKRDEFKNIKCDELDITLIRFKQNTDYILLNTLKKKIKKSGRFDIIDKYF